MQTYRIKKCMNYNRTFDYKFLICSFPRVIFSRIDTNEYDREMKKIFKSMSMFTDPFGKANTMEVLLKEGGQEMDVAKSSFRDIMKTQSADIESCIEYVHKSTPIQDFYDDQAVFITGATGFIGKLLIEKLLRECRGITCIYLLIRTKKGKSVLQRTKELIEDSVSCLL